MAAPSLISETSTSYNTSAASKTTGSISVQAGDIIEVTTGIEDTHSGAVRFTITDTQSNVYTKHREVIASSHTGQSISSATAGSTGSLTVTATKSAGDGTNVRWQGATVRIWRGSDGVGASAIENATNEVGGPSMDLLTTQANSAIGVALGDWNATAGTRTWRANAGAFTSSLAFLDGSHYWTGSGYHADAGAIATYALGQTAPTSQIHSMVALEIKGSAGGGAAEVIQLSTMTMMGVQ